MTRWSIAGVRRDPERASAVSVLLEFFLRRRGGALTCDREQRSTPGKLRSPQAARVATKFQVTISEKWAVGVVSAPKPPIAV